MYKQCVKLVDRNVNSIILGFLIIACCASLHNAQAAVPATPANLVAFSGNGIISLNWKRVTGALTYNVYRSASSSVPGTKLVSNLVPFVDTTNASPTSSPEFIDMFRVEYGDKDLTNGATYYYQVTSVNSSGESIKSIQVAGTPLNTARTLSKSRNLKIMPLGNSITSGWCTGDLGGYRAPLIALLSQANYQFDLVGSYTRESGTMADPYHEGYNSKTIGDLYHGMVVRALRTYDPDLILLEIGTNDFATGYASEKNITQLTKVYDSLLTKIFSLIPDVHVLAVPIPPIVVESFPNDTIKSFNRSIKALCQKYAQSGKSISFVDKMDTITATYMCDWLHPNLQGYQIMGKVWFDAINAMAAISTVTRNPKREYVNTSQMSPYRESASSLRVYSIKGTLMPRNLDKSSSGQPGVYIALLQEGKAPGRILVTR